MYQLDNREIPCLPDEIPWTWINRYSTVITRNSFRYILLYKETEIYQP